MGNQHFPRDASRGERQFADMPWETDPVDLVGAVRLQARTCRDHGSPMYGDLLEEVARDVEAGGPLADVLTGHAGDDPVADALALRLMGSAHRLVLERRAGDLAAFYPSVGGTWEPDGGWAAFRALAAEQPDALAEWLDRPPQTNEVGRAAALYGALLHLPADLPVRLTELGASGGLNLRADRFCYVDGEGRALGDPSSPVRIDPAWLGRSLGPGAPEVTERRGCDLRPVDVATPEGRLSLTAYVWADMTTRFERLRGAFAVAAEVPVEVRRQGAADFLSELDLVEGTTTVVWHSVVWQYLPAAERAAVSQRLEALGAGATPSRRLAHVAVEPVRRDPEPVFEVRLRFWPDGTSRLLGTTVPHGVPTRWT